MCIYIHIYITLERSRVMYISMIFFPPFVILWTLMMHSYRFIRLLSLNAWIQNTNTHLTFSQLYVNKTDMFCICPFKLEKTQKEVNSVLVRRLRGGFLRAQQKTDLNWALFHVVVLFHIHPHVCCPLYIYILEYFTRHAANERKRMSRWVDQHILTGSRPKSPLCNIGNENENVSRFS